MRRVLIIVCLLLAGCTASVSGRPTGGIPSLPTTPCASDPAAADGHYCTRFATRASSWQEFHVDGFAASWSPRLGGSWHTTNDGRIGFIDFVPYTAAATGNSAEQIDVDAIAGRSYDADRSSLGVTCWVHHVGAFISGFTFMIADGYAYIVMLDSDSGHPHVVATTSGNVHLNPYPQPNHLSVTCDQVSSSQGVPFAYLRFELNGAPMLQAVYARNVGHPPWTRSPYAGLYSSGHGADVYWDNLSIRDA